MKDNLSDNLQFAKLILEHKAFKESLELYFERAEKPLSIDIVEIMKHSNLYNVTEESTYKRRSATVRGWLEWILDLIN